MSDVPMEAHEPSWLVAVETRARRKDWMGVHAMTSTARDLYDVEFMLGQVLRCSSPTDSTARSLIHWIVNTWCPYHTWPVQSHCITFRGYVQNQSVIDDILQHNDPQLFPRVVSMAMWNIPAFFTEECSMAVDLSALHSALCGVSSWGKHSIQDVAFHALVCILQPRRDWFDSSTDDAACMLRDVVRMLWNHDLHRGMVLDNIQQRALRHCHRVYQARQSRASTWLTDSWAVIHGPSKRARDAGDSDDCSMAMSTLQITDDDDTSSSEPRRARVMHEMETLI